MPVYQGPNSCYALHEGFYVKRMRRKGIDTVREAAAILRLILRDYRRGWTYKQGSCRKIRMTRELFEKRVEFVSTLARFHGADKTTIEAVDKLVKYVLEHERLPKTITIGKKRVALRDLIRGMYVKVRKR